PAREELREESHLLSKRTKQTGDQRLIFWPLSTRLFGWSVAPDCRLERRGNRSRSLKSVRKRTGAHTSAARTARRRIGTAPNRPRIRPAERHEVWTSCREMVVDTARDGLGDSCADAGYARCGVSNMSIAVSPSAHYRPLLLVVDDELPVLKVIERLA